MLNQETAPATARTVMKQVETGILCLDNAGLITTWLNSNKRHYQVL
jgi:hypothetical protein